MGGGAEEQVMRLAAAFKARGWQTLIVSMLPPKVLPPDFAERGIPLVHLGMRRGIPDPRGILRLSRIIRQFRPDVVHSHMTHANLLARAARLVTPYPVLVCTLHNLTMAGVQRDHTRIFERLHRVTDPLAERTTAICHAAAAYYVQKGAVPSAKMIVVHNGIDCQRFAPDPEAHRRLRQQLGVENQFVWLAVGRLELQKAYPTLLNAFAQLNSAGHTLLICGLGSLRDELEHLTQRLQIADRVKFLGLRSDIPEIMNASDAFALSSTFEGLPLVLLQASATELPIVATNVSGNPEVVVEGETGFLVPPADPAAFAGAMARLTGCPPERRQAMGRAGRERTRAAFRGGTDRRPMGTTFHASS